MKRFRLFIPLAMLAFAVSCASVNPGSDPIVVRAEQSLSVAFATLDTFVHLDDAHPEWVAKFPQVRQYAEFLRVPVGNPPVARGISYIESATKVKDTYKKNRTPENKANLVTALAVLETAIAETQRQLSVTK